MYSFRHTEMMSINARYGLEMPNVKNTAKWFRMSKLIISVAFKIPLGSTRLDTHSWLGQNTPCRPLCKSLGRLVYLTEANTVT